jgi:uncharacterized protein (TIGR02453 family)
MQGFESETLKFLHALRSNNSKAWFTDHRDEYERSYLEPAFAFVEDAGKLLAQWRPDIQAVPKILGSVFRINHDARRANAGGPYKDHIDFYFWEGERRSAASAYFMRLSPELLGIGAGMHSFRPDERKRYRAAPLDELRDIVARLEQDGYAVGGAPKRVHEDPLETLRHYRALFVHVDFEPEVALDGAKLLRSSGKVWKDLTPLHAWLVEHVQA